MNNISVFIVLVFGITTVLSNKFHRDLVVHTCLRNGNKNVVISTLSLQFSLCKLATVAEGKAKEEIMNALEFSNDNEATQLYPKASAFIGTLRNVDMIWFNKMYIDYDKILNETFAKDSMNKFGVDVEKIGFYYYKTAKEFINREVDQISLKRVTHIIKDSDITNKTCMMLITGAHIRPTWMTRFNPQRTKLRSFYREGGAGMTQVDMMTRDEDVLYYDAAYYKIITSPLEWGTSITFVLPTAVRGMSGFLNDLSFNPDLMKELRKYMKWKLVTFTMPKFKIETDMDITDIFKMTKITEIFMKNTTSLKNVFKDRNVNKEMFVSIVKQKIILDLDEFGVVRDMKRSPFFEQQNHRLKSYSGTELEVVLDRPFYFAINLEKSIVFGGKYEDPYHELFSGIYYGPEKK